MAKLMFTCIFVSALIISSKALPTQVNATPANPIVPVVGQVTIAPAVNPLPAVASQMTVAATVNPLPTVASQMTVAPAVNPLPTVASQMTVAPAVNPLPTVAGQMTVAPAVNPLPAVAGQMTVASAVVPGKTSQMAVTTVPQSLPPVVVDVPSATAMNGSVSASSEEDVIDDEAIKTANVIIKAIDNLIAQKKSFSLAISDGLCNSEQSMLGSLLNRSLRKLILKLITSLQKQLSNIKISELPTYSDSFSSVSNVSLFQMKNIEIKGLESITISKLEFDICAMSFESEITVPSLVLTADYILKGVIDSSPIEGAGNLSVTVDSLYVYDQSFLDCNTVIFAEDVCKFSNKNKTVDINMKSVTVNISGVKYKDLSNEKINDGVNYFIGDFVKTNKLGLVQKITDLMVRFKSQTLDGYSPVSLLKKLKADMQNTRTQLKSKLRSLRPNNIFQNMFAFYL